MENYELKAKNYFILGKIAEKLLMYSESASNYFKALSAINDFMLEKKNLKANDHSERFRLLEESYPELYDITDRLFTIYRRTYTQELNKQEIETLRQSVEAAFKYAKVDIPNDEEIASKAQDIFKK